MAKGKTYIIERFIERYIERLCNHNNKELLEILIQDEITNYERLRNYMICHDFQLKLIDNGGRVYDTYSQIGDEYGLSDRQIASIISRWRKRFLQRSLHKS